MKSNCKNPEPGIASWVICCNWFSCTNLNALQTLLVSAGRILTWTEEQLSSSVPSAGKAHLGPRSAPRLSPSAGHATAWPRALPFPGLWARSPRGTGDSRTTGSKGKSGLQSQSCPCPPPHLQRLACGASIPAKQPCSWEEFGCFLMPSFILGFTEICFLSLSFIPTPSSHNTPQLPTPPSAHPSPLQCSTPA